MSNQPSGSVTRRGFVKGTGVLIGTAASSSLAVGQQAGGAGATQVPRQVLGRTGVQVSRLGIGCAPFQRQELGVDEVAEVLHRGLQLGVNYLDVAPNYGNDQTGFSEVKMGPTIKEIRDRVFLVTKTEEPTYEGTWKLLRQSMKRLQTDHFDLVHLHNVGHEPRFPDLPFALGDKGALGALREAQRQGVVRFIGASGHLHPSRFHDVLDTGQIDVLMNAVNFVVQHTYDFEHKVWSRARRENIGLVAMKVLGGTGAGRTGFRLPPEHYRNAIRYAMSLRGVASAVIGVASVSELEQAARTVTEAEPLTLEETQQLARDGLALAGADPWQTAYGTPLT
jgi:aryl-alcohol dehydrogenase-like predicted oxidoreductase